MRRIAPIRQLGQTLLWFLATLAASCVTLLVVYNVGQLSTEKEKTTNAADAVALSGALVQARGMNLLAYNNRAIVANEMTIAQITSLDGWVKYNYQLTYNLAVVTSWIPYVNDVTQTISDVMNQISSAVYQGAEIVVPAFQGVVDVLEAQRYVIITAIPFATNDIAKQVAQQNGVDLNDNLGFTLAADGANAVSYWNPILDKNNFLHNQTSSSGPNGSDERQPANDVIMNSRDQFSANRGPGWLIDGINFSLSLVPAITAQLVKSSGSAKLRDFDHWEAQDSLELDAQACAFGLCISLPVSGPVAWGRANAIDSNNSPTEHNWVNMGDCNGYGWGSACFWAYYNNDDISGFKGVPEMLDVKDRSKEIKYFVSVKKKGDALTTSQQLGFGTLDTPGPQGSTKVQDNLVKNEMPAISAARVFFKRPKGGDPTEGNDTVGHLARKDGLQEYASLYNPYWQARLHTPNCGVGNAFSDDCFWRLYLFQAQGVDPTVSGLVNFVTP
jgi:Putative Flp pilus-assembly TadE/G-like